ncbi:MAG: hypothetical protein ACSHWN_12340 [Methylophilaceae bacterium]
MLINKTKTMQIRMEDAFYEQLKFIASSHGVSASEYVRKVLEYAVRQDMHNIELKRKAENHKAEVRKQR